MFSKHSDSFNLQVGIALSLLGSAYAATDDSVKSYPGADQARKPYLISFDGNDVIGIKHGEDASGSIREPWYSPTDNKTDWSVLDNGNCDWSFPDKLPKDAVNILEEFAKLKDAGVQVAYNSKLNVVDKGKRMFETYHSKKLTFIKDHLGDVFKDRIWFVTDKPDTDSLAMEEFPVFATRIT